MIKAIFVDLDGTLLNEEKEVSKFDIEAIRQAEQNGIEVIITTGRSRKVALDIREKLGATRYIISSNGSDIYDIKSNKTIYNSPIESDLLKKIYNIAKTNNLRLAMNIDDKLYINKILYKDDKKEFLLSEEQIKKYIENKNVVQIVLLDKDRDIMKKVKLDIEKLKEIKIENQSLGLIDGCEKISRTYFLDIINKCNNKAKAIKRLCEYLKIDLSEIAAIGDSPNDIPMLEIAKDKVSMGNGTEEIKKIANIITDTNTNSGVGKYIKSIL